MEFLFAHAQKATVSGVEFPGVMLRYRHRLPLGLTYCWHTPFPLRFFKIDNALVIHPCLLVEVNPIHAGDKESEHGTIGPHL